MTHITEHVKCVSGLMGWQCRLRENYTDLTEWRGCSETWGLHERLGFERPEQAWDANPLIQGSVVPEDFRIVKADPAISESLQESSR